MRAIIFSNGCIKNYFFYKEIIKAEDYVICADGGAIHAMKMNVTPHLVIGDLDSISADVKEAMIQQGIAIRVFSPDKNETDTQLAIEAALDKGCNEILMIGSLGSRYDHSFANISLLKMILDRGAAGKILNEHNEIYLIQKEIGITGKEGDKISLLPVSNEVTGITTTGLKYALNKSVMKFGNPYGVSNVFETSYVTIVIEAGLLMVIKAVD